MRFDKGNNRRQSFGSRGAAPVKVGDELDVKIEAVGEKGDGVAKKDGFVLFVPGTKQGESVRIKVTRVLKSVGFAEVLGQSTGAEPTSDPGQESGSEESYEESSGSEETSQEENSDSQDSEDFGEEGQ